MRFQNNRGADPPVRGRPPVGLSSFGARRRRHPLSRHSGSGVIRLIGFAVDLGILYSMKGELKAGASAMALAAAQQLIGTERNGAATRRAN